MKRTTISADLETTVSVPVDGVRLEGGLAVPERAAGIVVFAHGSGSSRHSPRNRDVAEVLQEGGLATLLFDLLTPKEEVLDARTAALRFDAEMLARRLLGATDWLARRPGVDRLKVGYFGASSGGGAALVAAAGRPRAVGAVVSRGGRPDLAGEALSRVTAPVLLIVGENDREVLALNHEAMQRFAGPKRLEIVPGATHLFEEPGALEEVARLARDWFLRYLVPERP
jgi:putative phosphoribosyl transferase